MKIDTNDLYGIRMLVFLEVEPQSNRYTQVLLNPKQFKIISGTIGTVIGVEEEKEIVKWTCSEEEYTLPDLQEIYTDDETK